MKLGPVTKIDKINTPTSTNFDDDIMSENHYVIFFFPIYIKFGAVQKPYS